MTALPSQEDGNLPAALRDLEDATNKLISNTPKLAGRHDCPNCHNNNCPNNCKTHTCIGHPTPTESLYMQLYDAVGAGRTGTNQTGSRPRSLPTGWLDAQQLLDEIDFAIALWQPAYTGVLPTIGRLKWMLKTKYRPQDVHGLEQKTHALNGWANGITNLFDPKPKWSLPNPCPACDVKIVRRPDSAGDVVRQPALQIGPNGCFCANCKTVWGPERFVFLAKVLGSLPANVLE